MNKEYYLDLESEDEVRLISLEALEFLGYEAFDGVDATFGEHHGELMRVENIETGEEASFCCLYIPNSDAALIISQRFEEVLDKSLAL